jgi:hypothetical protein
VARDVTFPRSGEPEEAPLGVGESEGPSCRTRTLKRVVTKRCASREFRKRLRSKADGVDSFLHGAGKSAERLASPLGAGPTIERGGFGAGCRVPTGRKGIRAGRPSHDGAEMMRTRVFERLWRAQRRKAIRRGVLASRSPRA